MDNHLRRKIADATDSEAPLLTPSLSERAEIFKARSHHEIRVHIGDLVDPEFMFRVVREGSAEIELLQSELEPVADTVSRRSGNI